MPAAAGGRGSAEGVPQCVRVRPRYPGTGPGGSGRSSVARECERSAIVVRCPPRTAPRRRCRDVRRASSSAPSRRPGHRPETVVPGHLCPPLAHPRAMSTSATVSARTSAPLTTKISFGPAIALSRTSAGWPATGTGRPASRLVVDLRLPRSRGAQRRPTGQTLRLWWHTIRRFPLRHLSTAMMRMGLFLDCNWRLTRG